MRPLRDGRWVGAGPHGVEVACALDGEEEAVRVHVLWRRADVVRVLFVRGAGLQEARTWATLPAGADAPRLAPEALGALAEDVPWAGRSRLDVADYPSVPFDVRLDPDGDGAWMRTAELAVVRRLCRRPWRRFARARG
jgi:hypothetical protein